MSSVTGALDVLNRAAGSVPSRPGSVTLERSGGVARLWLDNPGSRNAITLGMMVDLGEAVQALADGDEGLPVGEGACCNTGERDAGGVVAPEQPWPAVAAASASGLRTRPGGR